MSRFAPTSTPRVGSSAMSTAGWASMARANMSFCWLPPESAAGMVSSSLDAATRRSASFARVDSMRRRTKPNRPSERRLARLTFSRTGRRSIRPSSLRDSGIIETFARSEPERRAGEAGGPGGHLAGGDG